MAQSIEPNRHPGMLHQSRALRSNVNQHAAGTTGSAFDSKPFHNRARWLYREFSLWTVRSIAVEIASHFIKVEKQGND